MVSRGRGLSEQKQHTFLDREWSIRKSIIDTFDSLSKSCSPLLPHNIVCALPDSQNVWSSRIRWSKARRTQEFIIDYPALHAISVKPLFALFAGDVGEVWVVGFEAEAI